MFMPGQRVRASGNLQVPGAPNNMVRYGTEGEVIAKRRQLETIAFKVLFDNGVEAEVIYEDELELVESSAMEECYA